MSTNPKSINFRDPDAGSTGRSLRRKHNIDLAVEGVNSTNALTPAEVEAARRSLQQETK